jgi:phenylpropionate dioxygenase-like ring-hydroxylating dioxygenase large terminal subunit
MSMLAETAQTVVGYAPNRFLKRYGDEVGTGPVSIEPFISEDYFEKERERIFRRTWINIGRVEQIPKPGDFFVKDLAVACTSIWVVREPSGSIRAFHNVCQHRGNKLVWAEKGTCKGTVSCGYHGWTYDTDGRLRHVSDEANFWHLDKDKIRLMAVAVDTWKGFIFVNLDPAPKEDLRSYLGIVAEELKDYPFEQLPNGFRYEVEVKANWKICATSQEEGYHLPYVHKQSHGRAIPHDEAGNFRSLEIALLGLHSRITTGPHPGFQPSAMEQVTMRYLSGFVDAFASASGGEGHRHTFDYYSIFPNFHMLVLNGNYLRYNFWPLAVDRTLWEITAFYPYPRNAGEALAIEYGRCAGRDIVSEDVPLHEAIQSTLRSGAITSFTFHDEETCSRQTMRLVDDYVQGRR